MAGRRAAQEHGAKGRAAGRQGLTEQEQEQVGQEEETGEGQPVARQTREAPEAAHPVDPGREREQAVIRGGPGQEGFTFKYGNREFATQEELTEFIDGLRTPRTETRQTRTTEARQPEQPRQEQTRQQQPEQKKSWFDEVDWDNEFVLNPKQTAQKMREGITKEISGALREEYRNEQILTQWWSDFYKENPTLVGKADIVNMQFQRNLNEIADQPGKKARDMLAEKTNAYLDELFGGERRQTRESTTSRTTVEGGGETSRRGARQQQTNGAEQQPQTLTSLIKARRAARQQSAR